MSRFQGKVVLVTGGTGGIGSSAVQLFLAEGASVFVTDIEERPDILGQLSIGDVSRIKFRKCDVADPSDCESVVTACVEAYGALDILFHNAGMLSPLGTVVEHDVGLFQKVVATDLLSLFYLARAAIPHMRKRLTTGLGGPAIVSTASTARMFGEYGVSAYSTAKAGLINLTRTMALDHAREGIRINCVCPGYTRTPMVQIVTDTAPIREKMLEVIPMGRSADPDEIAKVVAFLASDDTSYITGQAIIVDGGVLAGSGFPCIPRILEGMKG